MSRLWLALRVVNLPLVGCPAYSAEHPVCVQEKQRVIYANSAALNAGVHIGMDVTTARLLSNAITHQRDPKQEQEYLDQLATQLYTFTPYIHIRRSQIVPDSGVLLEISRCLKLFGGVEKLCNKILIDLADASIAYGLAHTEEGAWLLSYEDYPISDNQDKSIFIAKLNCSPIERLSEWPKEVEALKRTGFSQLGDISKQIDKQSISGIKSRFGRDFAEFIARIFGIEQNFLQTNLFEKPAQIHQPKEIFFDTVQFDYPITQIDQLRTPFEQRLQKLSEFLCKRKLACQRIEWHFFDIYQNSHSIKIDASMPQNTWKLFYDLTFIQLESKQLPFAVDAIELICDQLQQRQEQNQNLDFSGNPRKNRGNDDLAILEGKLKARLGENAFFKVSYKDSHIPELTCEKIAVFATTSQQLPPAHQFALRPTWLFEAPLPVRKQRALFWRGALELLAGPERIEGQWWANITARDYYVARREDGLRVWLYRDLSSDDWFVQGIFAA